MTLAIAHAAIRRRLEKMWKYDVPIQYPAVKFSIPNKKSWLRMSINDAEATWASFGVPFGNTERQFGQVMIQIFTLSGEGEGKAMDIADKLKKIYRSWEDCDSGVRFLVPPYTNQVGIDGRWYQVNFIAPFQFDNFN